MTARSWYSSTIRFLVANGYTKVPVLLFASWVVHHSRGILNDITCWTLRLRSIVYDSPKRLDRCLVSLVLTAGDRRTDIGYKGENQHMIVFSLNNEIKALLTVGWTNYGRDSEVKATYFCLTFCSWSSCSDNSLTESCCFLRRAASWVSPWRCASSRSRRSFCSSASRFLFTSSCKAFPLRVYIPIGRSLLIDKL